MKKNTYVVLACLVLLLISCDNSKDPVNTVKNEIHVKVYNAKTWNSVTNKMDTVVGCTVKLISDSAIVTAVTNSKGEAVFSAVKAKGYSIVATKDDLSNLINTTVVNNELAGNLIIGVYTSQTDIDNSARYSTASVGGLKLYDLNGDGIINANDVTLGSPLLFESKYKDVNADGKIDVYDIVNGTLVKIDNIVNMSVFIGK